VGGGELLLGANRSGELYGAGADWASEAGASGSGRGRAAARQPGRARVQAEVGCGAVGGGRARCVRDGAGASWPSCCGQRGRWSERGAVAGWLASRAGREHVAWRNGASLGDAASRGQAEAPARVAERGRGACRDGTRRV
jgi:hypothetical protein